tara:strand:+ start:18631 stop:18840 length:210 start_codon:yes stop_codon:yes gene_type:complete
VKPGDIVKMRYHNDAFGIIIEKYNSPTVKIGNRAHQLNANLYDILCSNGKILCYMPSMGLEAVNENAKT